MIAARKNRGAILDVSAILAFFCVFR